MYEEIHATNIHRNPAANARVAVNDAVVNDYAELMRSGITFPALIVYKVGQEYHLVDGLHRLLAYEQAQLPVVRCQIMNGSLQDAILHSLRSNAEHGLARTNADKRKNVQTMLDDATWSQLSNREISKACGVTHTLVNSMQKVETASTSKHPRPSDLEEPKRLSKKELDEINQQEQANLNSELISEREKQEELIAQQTQELAILRAQEPTAAQEKSLELAEELEALKTKFEILYRANKDTESRHHDALGQIRKQKARISYLEKEAREYKKTIELQALEIASLKDQPEVVYPF
jgi:ParB-like chromosome segregation protein Spo0J